VYIQCLLDTLLVTSLVYATGGIESVYSMLYPLIILYSALFLGKNGAALVASACSIFYGVLVNLEFHGIIYPIYGGTYQHSVEAGHVFLRICIHIASFYAVALLASFVVGLEKKTQDLLSEKESAFDQLDILHKSIIESVGSGVMTVDLENRIKSFNRAAEEIAGIPSSDAMGRDVDDIFPDFSVAINSVNLTGGGFPVARRFEIELSSKRKRRYWDFPYIPLSIRKEKI